MNQDYSHLYGAPQTTAPPLPQGQDPQPEQPAVPPKPFVLNSSEAELPPPRPFSMNSTEVLPPPPPVFQAPPQAAPKPKKPRQPFSPTSFLLIAGVAFLFLGGVLVLKQTWSTLADSVRAIILLCISVMFFGANLIAEKVFKLPKTGLAFYILGSIFLPMSVAGIGIFKLWGEWFSFAGDGQYFLCAVIAACVALSTCIGAFSYKYPILAWLSLAATAASAIFLCGFAVHPLERVQNRVDLFSGLLTAFTALSLGWTEWQLRRKPDSAYGKAALWYMYPLMILTAGLTASMAIYAEDCKPVIPAILCTVLGAGFFYPRFRRRSVHIGAFGILICLLGIFGSVTRADVFAEIHMITRYFFMATGTALTLMGFFWIPKLSDVMRKTAVRVGVIATYAIFLPSIGLGYSNHETGWLLLLQAMIALGVLFFLLTPKNPFTADTLYCVLTSVLLFHIVLIGTSKDNASLMTMLLVFTALLLVAQGFLGKKLWCFVLAGSAAAGMLILNLEHSFAWMLWLCAGISLGGVIYSHLMRRQLLEKSFAWCFVPACLTAFAYTLCEISPLKEFDTHITVTCILMLALLTVMYLLEIAAFPLHERVKGTRLYLEILSGIASFVAFIACLVEKEIGIGFLFLTLILLGVYTVVFVCKRINLIAIPHLLMFYFTARRLITMITPMQVTSWELALPGNMTVTTAANLMQIGCFILVLVLLAVTGRLLLPKFYESGEGLLRLDLPLLTGVLVIISTVATIQWHPAMLFCLFMCVYSLFFIGRLDNRYIPALLASLFGCLTLLFHNIDDPFELLNKLSVLDIKTLQILLYLLPAHIFILTLLFILPAKCRNGVHIARFVMYCVTMLTLLCASMYFKNVTDALVLVIFSFLIMVGSFVPKRLRWFVLGFSVLVFMTIRLTWSFWTSLHWGIYLFLAGILLIVIASLFEYSARYAREHPDAPKKKFNLFATWKW